MFLIAIVQRHFATSGVYGDGIFFLNFQHRTLLRYSSQFKMKKNLRSVTLLIFLLNFLNLRNKISAQQEQQHHHASHF
jgi:hypothetical protein